MITQSNQLPAPGCERPSTARPRRLKPLGPCRAWETLFGAILIAAFAANAPAQLLYQDTFAYPDGPVLTAPDSPWVNNYAPTNQINVVAGKLALSQTAEESVRYNFPTSYSHTNLYAGFQVQFSALPAGQGNYFAFFRAGGTDALLGRLWTTTNGAAPGKFRLGVYVISSAAAMVPIDLSLGVTYDVVMRFNAQFIVTNTLWINPSSESDLSRRAEDSQGGVTYSYGHFGFKQVAWYEDHNNGMGELTVDNLKIGFSFASVRPPPVITSISGAANGAIALQGLGTPTTNYSVMAKTDLAAVNWISIGSATANALGIIQFTDPDAASRPARFYRLLAQ